MGGDHSGAAHAPHAPRHALLTMHHGVRSRACDVQVRAAKKAANVPRPAVVQNRRPTFAPERDPPPGAAPADEPLPTQVGRPRGLCVRTQPSQLRGSTHPRAGSFRSSARTTVPICLMSRAWASTSSELLTRPARSRLSGRCSCSTSPPNSSTTFLCLRSVPPRSGHAGVRVRDCTGVGLQLLNDVLGMPVEGHVEEINDYRCPVSTARHF